MRQPPSKERVIGLTGNIASGKSTVARLLEKLGVPVIDADQVSKEVSAPGGPAYQKIMAAFGTADRGELRELAFKNPEKRKQLEAIVHPEIQKRTHELFRQKFANGHNLIIYEASLIFEAGRQKDFDGILTVTCPEKVRIARLLKRDPSLSAEIAQKMIESQMPQTEKAQLSQWVIDNDGTFDDLEKNVLAWLSRVR